MSQVVGTVLTWLFIAWMALFWTVLTAGWVYAVLGDIVKRLWETATAMPGRRERARQRETQRRNTRIRQLEKELGIGEYHR